MNDKIWKINDRVDTAGYGLVTIVSIFISTTNPQKRVYEIEDIRTKQRYLVYPGELI